MQLRNVRHLTAVVTTAILVTSSAAHAAATSSFDALRAELLARANSLTGSVDKVEQKLGKTCVKVIAAIDKSTTLSGDIKALGKISKTLLKAFPDDFVLEAAVTELLVVNDLSDLLEGSLSNLVATIQTELDEIQTEINALPEGSAKTSAQTAHDTAQDLLNQAGTSPDFALAAKALSSSLKSLLSAIKTIDKANDSNGDGGGNGLQCRINGVQHNAPAAAGVYVNITGQFTVNGPALNGQKAVNISAVNVVGPGPYPAGAGTGVIDIAGGKTYSSNLSGTVYIATFNLAQQKASGTFTFSASQTTPSPVATNIVEVIQGSFNISTIQQF
ncbi:MAG: hypothetical protein PCFJNLEI_03745 [Verrucomicrobiae bacterium]|nr:hypothetical protein [Verrucomicrobiae bacterium]